MVTVRRFLLYLSGVVGIVAMGYALIVYFTNEPPTEEIARAGEMLSKAKQGRAALYDGEKIKEAEDFFGQSMEEWERQNDIFFVFRDYTSARNLANKSYSLAKEADNIAGNIKNKLQVELETRLKELRLKIENFEKYYKHLPLNYSVFDLYNKGKIKYMEADYEFNKSEFINAMALAIQASEEITRVEKSAYLKLVNYYDGYPEWEKNVKTAYELSGNGQLVILIDKIQSSCTLIKGGKAYKVFISEFGLNWMDDKIKSGDGATPEGVYKVTKKMNGSQTQYYKALQINYPNSMDNARFNELLKKGEIEKDATIGGLIEIHGDGGKGVHWTNGCIALENNDMDILYSQCAVNTPVIIVGASLPINEYLNL